MILQQPLRHAYPSWEPPHNDPHSSELVEVFRGDMRIVRNKRRAKLLQRRGVPMWQFNDVARGREWLWFVESRAVIEGGAA